MKSSVWWMAVLKPRDKHNPDMIRLALILALVHSGILTAQETTSLPISQETAISMALQKNFNIRIEQIDPQIQKQIIRQAKSEFDPNFSASYSESTDALGLESDLSKASIEGKLPFGTSYEIGVRSESVVSDSYSHSGFGGITITQPILKGFGLSTNWAFVRIADKQHKLEEWELKQTAMDVIFRVITAYNAYFLAKQNADIAAQNRDLAKKLIEDNQKRIEQGMMAPVDIAVAEAELAVRDERVLRAQSQFGIQQNNLKKLILDDFSTATQTNLNISQLPTVSEPTTSLLNDFYAALEQQPEHRIQQIGLEIEAIRLQRAQNQTLPEISIDASYGRSSLGTSPWNSLKTLSDGREEHSFGARLSYPIFNRNAQASWEISKLRFRKQELAIEQLKQEIMLDLHSQILLVETNWKRIQASKKARDLSNLMLEAEQKKLKAGTSSTFVVLRLQNDVANAQIREFQAISDYHISQARLGRLKGTL